MAFFSVTNIAMCVFLVYISHSIWTIYHVYYIPPCPETSECLPSWLQDPKNMNLKLKVYGSSRRSLRDQSHGQLILDLDGFDPSVLINRAINVSLPRKTRNNGTYFLHMYVLPANVNEFSSSNEVFHSFTVMTQYAEPKTEAFNLMGGSNETAPKKRAGQKQTHWRSRVVLSVMNDAIKLDARALPPEVFKFVKVDQKRRFIPIIYIDELSFLSKDLVIVKNTTKEVPLSITYQPISLGKLRFWENIKQSMNMLEGLGFGEKEVEEMKGIFVDTTFYFLMMTFLVSALHLLFDFLAFKNDISYWRKRKTMIGLSTRAVTWRCISTGIIFVYLMDQNTSLLVLVPAGISVFIEIWKLKKAFKLQIVWATWIPRISRGETSVEEKQTEGFDAEAMKYMSFVLYPLCSGGAIYSLIYVPHKSWYSWCIQSLVNGVYAFGFLFMLPQLFVNYKLKSVAHLPWKAFMYKAFNTFIDDIFAFIITMPTAHRVACFRDDAVFLVYLYQRWLYPVDKARVNEFGQSFDDQGDTNVKTKKE